MEACLADQLEGPYEETVQILRWCTYGSGAILSAVLERRSVDGWTEAVAVGRRLDELTVQTAR